MPRTLSLKGQLPGPAPTSASETRASTDSRSCWSAARPLATAVMSGEATSGAPWEEYRRDLIRREREAQVLALDLLTLVPLRLPAWGGEEVEGLLKYRRKRHIGCLRAGAKIVVLDPAIALPPNPFVGDGTIAGLRFDDSATAIAAELEAAALAAAGKKPLCEAIPAAETAMERWMVEHGYLDGWAAIQWPDAPRPAMTLEVRTSPGMLHLVGEYEIDQSEVPEEERLAEDELRRRLAADATPGAIATMPAIEAAERTATALAAAAGLSAEFGLTRLPEGEGARVFLEVKLRAGDGS